MLRVAIALSLALAAVACGAPADGEHAGLESYEPPGGEYRLHYRKPPWKRVLPPEDEPPSGTTAELLVEPNAASIGGVDAGVPAKYDLRVELQSGEARSRAERAERRATSRGETVLDGPRPVLDGATLRGWEVLTVEESPPARHFRFVYLDRPSGGVVHMGFAATPELDDGEVDEMVALLEVDPEPEAEP